jgi:hypothetical protein
MPPAYDEISEYDSPFPVCRISDDAVPTGVAPHAAAANTMLVTGVVGFGQFLNGSYTRQRNVVHCDRPTFRSALPNSAAAGVAAGRYMYMYYHGENKAWVLGLKITAIGTGAAAYCTHNRALPCGPNFGTDWQVSDISGTFVPVPTALCTAVYGGSTVVGAEVGEQSGAISRQESERILLTEAEKGGGASRAGNAGLFVIRESTSLPNALVLTILLSRSRIMHNPITVKGSDAGGYIIGRTRFPTMARLLAHCQSVGLAVDPRMALEYGEKIKLRRCLRGEGEYV